MAEPTMIALLVKTTLAAAKDKRTWTVIGTIFAAVFILVSMPLIILLSIAFGVSEHSKNTVQLIFLESSCPTSTPSEYQIYVSTMQKCLCKLDAAVVAVNQNISGQQLDPATVKAVFYALYFKGGYQQSLDDGFYKRFVDCFVKGQGSVSSCARSTTVTSEILASTDEVYKQIGALIGRPVTDDEKNNITYIYRLLPPMSKPVSGT